MKTIRVIPIRPTFDPVTKKFLPPQGREVEKTAYWIKRILNKSVIAKEV